MDDEKLDELLKQLKFFFNARYNGSVKKHYEAMPVVSPSGGVYQGGEVYLVGTLSETIRALRSLREENARLRNALAPFSDIAEGMAFSVSPPKGEVEIFVSVSDLCEARAALTPSPTQRSEG
jgi:uncharacterized protein YaaQ